MDDGTLHIYTYRRTPATDYITGHIAANIIGCRYTITDNPAEAQKADICYSPTRIGDGLHIHPSGLLEKPEAYDIGHIPVGMWQGLPTLLHDGIGDTGFDLFAAAFFCLSRMEEIGAGTLDRHGRYKPDASILSRLGIIGRPIVDEWCARLGEMLSRERHIHLAPRKEEQRIVTIDVDHAFKYRHKGLLRTLLGTARDIVHGDKAQLRERISVMTGAGRDPYFCFDYITQALSGDRPDTRIFIHAGPMGRYDRKSHHNREFDAAVKALSADFTIGIHPSYHASFDTKAVRHEIDRLRRLTSSDVTSCRMHYLRLRIPDTYRMLDSLGITDDYTMAYSGATGFRAGTAIPYRFFDINAGRTLGITVHTTCAMDVTMKNTLGLTPSQAIGHLSGLYDRVKDTGGEFITLIHNSSLGEDTEWQGWREVMDWLTRH